MNAKKAKLIRKYAEIKKIHYRTAKHVFESGGKDKQQMYLAEMKSIIDKSKSVAHQ